MFLSVIQFAKVALTLLNNLLELAREKSLVSQGRTEAFNEISRQTEAQVTKAARVDEETKRTHVTIDTDDAFDRDFERK